MGQESALAKGSGKNSGEVKFLRKINENGVEEGNQSTLLDRLGGKKEKIGQNKGRGTSPQ